MFTVLSSIGKIAAQRISHLVEQLSECLLPALGYGRSQGFA